MFLRELFSLLTDTVFFPSPKHESFCTEVKRLVILCPHPTPRPQPSQREGPSLGGAKQFLRNCSASNVIRS